MSTATQTRRTDILERIILSTGEALVIQKIGRRFYTYTASIFFGDPPHYLAEGVSLHEARVAYADALQEDVCG